VPWKQQAATTIRLAPRDGLRLEAKLSSEVRSGAILPGLTFLQSPEKKTPSDDYPKLVGRTVQSELIRTRQIAALSFRIALWMAALWR